MAVRKKNEQQPAIRSRQQREHDAASTSGVDPVLRRGKIVQNLELLRKEFGQLAPDARARVRLLVADLALPAVAVGLDEGTRGGSLIVARPEVLRPPVRGP